MNEPAQDDTAGNQGPNGDATAAPNPNPNVPPNPAVALNAGAQFFSLASLDVESETSIPESGYAIIPGNGG